MTERARMPVSDENLNKLIDMCDVTEQQDQDAGGAWSATRDALIELRDARARLRKCAEQFRQIAVELQESPHKNTDIRIGHAIDWANDMLADEPETITERELEAAIAKIAELEVALRAVEWGFNYSECSACHASKYEGIHTADCIVGRALTASEGGGGTVPGNAGQDVVKPSSSAAPTLPGANRHAASKVYKTPAEEAVIDAAVAWLAWRGKYPKPLSREADLLDAVAALRKERENG